MDTPAERAEYALHSARTDLAAAQRLIAQDPAALDPDQLAALEPGPDNDHVLLCGNPHMIDDCYSLLRERGFRAKRVTREKYVFAKEAKAGPVAAPSDDPRS